MKSPLCPKSSSRFVHTLPIFLSEFILIYIFLFVFFRIINSSQNSYLNFKSNTRLGMTCPAIYDNFKSKIQFLLPFLFRCFYENNVVTWYPPVFVYKLTFLAVNVFDICFAVFVFPFFTITIWIKIVWSIKSNVYIICSYTNLISLPK